MHDFQWTSKKKMINSVRVHVTWFFSCILGIQVWRKITFRNIRRNKIFLFFRLLFCWDILCSTLFSFSFNAQYVKVYQLECYSVRTQSLTRFHKSFAIFNKFRNIFQFPNEYQINIVKQLIIFTNSPNGNLKSNIDFAFRQKECDHCKYKLCKTDQNDSFSRVDWTQLILLTWLIRKNPTKKICWNFWANWNNFIEPAILTINNQLIPDRPF